MNDIIDFYYRNADQLIERYKKLEPEKVNINYFKQIREQWIHYTLDT